MKVIVGLSGGVDSSVTAVLLKQAGHDVIGVTMRIRQPDMGSIGACFGATGEAGEQDAAAFCREIGIQHFVLDCSEIFRKTILGYFHDDYMGGRTPNPCVKCNSLLKFGLLPEKARTEGIEFDKFATGHYARITTAPDGRFQLLRAVDKNKDQSYFLYRLSQEQLARQLFPLGELTKDKVRKIAAELGLKSSDRPDSQDFYCGDRGIVLNEPDKPGNIVSVDGKILGRHDGFWKFTIGQRRGIRLQNPDPLYVVRIDAAKNEVIVGPKVFTIATSLVATDCNWISNPPKSGETIPVEIKVRSVGEPKQGASVKTIGDGKFEASFPDGISGIAPGQSAVFFNGDIVLGGGIIS